MEQIIQKLKQVGDHNKFSWAEAFSDTNGKTSITAILVFATTIVGLITLAIGVIHYILTKDSTLINNGLGTTGLGSGGTALRKYSNSKYPVPMEDTVVASTPKPDLVEEG